jgi:hypothetical protein
MNKLGYGAQGAPDDRYAGPAPLPSVDDPQYADAIAEYIRQHPGTSRSEALNYVLRNRRDAKAAKALVESLASGIADGADIAWLNDQIVEFEKHIIAGDVGDDGIEVRKQAA